MSASSSFILATKKDPYFYDTNYSENYFKDQMEKYSKPTKKSVLARDSGC